ncbi:MAG: hypothetical protein WCA07_07520 [Gloeobacterales cyanobacterium]
MDRNTKGLSLPLVVFISALLLVLVTTLLFSSNQQLQRSVWQRSRVGAGYAAESGLATMRTEAKSILLDVASDGGALPERTSPLQLGFEGDELYFARFQKAESLGTSDEITLDDLVTEDLLPTSYAQTPAPWLRQDGAQRWWLYRFGPVQWFPLNLETLLQGEGKMMVAQRTVDVVGEVLGQQNPQAKKLLSQNLEISLNLNQQIIHQRPEASLTLLSKATKAPALNIEGSNQPFSTIQVTGPIWIQSAADKSVILKNNVKVLSYKLDKDKDLFYNQLYRDNLKSDALIFSGPNNGLSVESPASWNVTPEPLTQESLEAYLPKRLIKWLAERGTQASAFRQDQNLISDQKELIYDAKERVFDFSKARYGILVVKDLSINADKFSTFRYRGRGTLIVQGALVLENLSLLPERAEDSLSILVSPTDLNAPAIRLRSLSPEAPSTILADQEGQPIMLSPKETNPDPQSPSGILRRTRSAVTIDKITLPLDTRLVAISEDLAVVPARLNPSDPERDPELVVAIGGVGQGRVTRLEYKSVPGKVLPLGQIKAQVFTTGAVEILGSFGVRGSLLADNLQIRPAPNPGAQNLIYGGEYGDRYLTDFTYAPMPATVGSLLVTMRNNHKNGGLVDDVVAQAWNPLSLDVIRASLTTPLTPPPAAKPVAESVATSVANPGTQPATQPSTPTPTSPKTPFSPPASPVAVIPPSPQAESPAPLPLAVPKPGSFPEKFRLQSIAEQDRSRLAVLEVQQGEIQKSVDVTKGDVVGSGWTVQEITHDSVLLRKAKASQRLRL